MLLKDTLEAVAWFPLFCYDKIPGFSRFFPGQNGIYPGFVAGAGGGNHGNIPLFQIVLQCTNAIYPGGMQFLYRTANMVRGGGGNNNIWEGHYSHAWAEMEVLR